MNEENLNCTVVTALYNLNRENWQTYDREWSDYLECFSNTLSLRAKFVIFIEPELENYVLECRRRVDPQLEYTKIVLKRFDELSKYPLKERISDVMNSNEYKVGLVTPDPPEYTRPDYIILIHSKMDLVEESIDLDFYGTDFYMWVDAGIRHRLFREEDKFKLYPNPKKIEDIQGVRILCRSFPQESDLNLKYFYKSHINRFGAGVIVGEKNKIRKFN